MVTTPSFLFDTYKRYKDETQTFISWLGETARKCGQSSQPEGTKKGRSKKKVQAPLVTKLALSDIVTLAKAISQSGASVEIPSHILRSLKFVIAQRKKCAVWFSQQSGGETLQRANESHSFVIDIFEKAFGILSPSTETTKPAANRQASVEEEEEDSEIEFVNSFAGLEVEDFSDTEVNSWAQPAAVPKKKKGPSKNVYEMEVSEEDLYFSLFCFFSDLNEIRTYLKGLWSDYHQGKLDLIVSSHLWTRYKNLISDADRLNCNGYSIRYHPSCRGRICTLHSTRRPKPRQLCQQCWSIVELYGRLQCQAGCRVHRGVLSSD